MDRRHDQTIQRAVEQYLPFLDWRIYKAQLWQESRFDPKATSPVGARGVAQIMPATWAQWAPRADMQGRDPYDAEASILTGACYMAHLYGQWYSPRPQIDRLCLALASYNAGLGHLVTAQKKVGGALLYRDIIRGLPMVTGKHSAETSDYVRKILGYYNKEITG